jgi:hypothetical protein
MYYMTLSQLKHWQEKLFYYIVTLMSFLSVNKIGVCIYEYGCIPYDVSIHVTVYGTAPLSKITASLYSC